MKRICSFQKIFFTQLFVPATRFDYYPAVCSRCWNSGHVRRSSLYSDVLRQRCGEILSVSAQFKCDNIDSGKQKKDNILFCPFKAMRSVKIVRKKDSSKITLVIEVIHSWQFICP